MSKIFWNIDGKGKEREKKRKREIGIYFLNILLYYFNIQYLNFRDCGFNRDIIIFESNLKVSIS